MTWVFLRNVGTSALYMFVGKTENPKVIIKRSLLVSLLRCCVHLVPMAVTGFVTWLNLAGYFLGDQMPGGAANRDRDFLLLQIAAKVTVCHYTQNSMIREDFAYHVRSAGTICGRISGISDHEYHPDTSIIIAWYPSRAVQLPFPIQ